MVRQVSDRAYRNDGRLNVCCRGCLSCQSGFDLVTLRALRKAKAFDHHVSERSIDFLTSACDIISMRTLNVEQNLGTAFYQRFRRRANGNPNAF